MKTPLERKVTPAQSSPFYFVCVGEGLYRWFVALGYLVDALHAVRDVGVHGQVATHDAVH